MKIVGLLCSIMILASSTPAQATENLGTYRITEYCAECNDPSGWESASGKHLEDGHVAMNGVPIGTIIEIQGKQYEVVDRCGIDGTVDIFKETEGCQCNRMDYQTVKIIK